MWNPVKGEKHIHITLLTNNDNFDNIDLTLRAQADAGSAGPDHMSPVARPGDQDGDQNNAAPAAIPDGNEPQGDQLSQPPVLAYHAGMSLPLAKHFYDRVVRISAVPYYEALSDTADPLLLLLEALRPPVTYDAILDKQGVTSTAQRHLTYSLRTGMPGILTHEYATQAADANRLTSNKVPLYLLGQSDFKHRQIRTLTPVGEQTLSLMNHSFSKAYLTATSGQVQRPMSTLSALFPLQRHYLSSITSSSASAFGLVARFLIFTANFFGSGSNKVSFNTSDYLISLPATFNTRPAQFGVNFQVTLVTLDRYLREIDQFSKDYTAAPGQPNPIIYAYSAWTSELWFDYFLVTQYAQPVMAFTAEIPESFTINLSYLGRNNTPDHGMPGSYTPATSFYRYPGNVKPLIVLLDSPTHITVPQTGHTMELNGVHTFNVSDYSYILERDTQLETRKVAEAAIQAWDYIASRVATPEEITAAARVAALVANRFAPMGYLQVACRAQYSPNARSIVHGFCSTSTSQQDNSVWDCQSERGNVDFHWVASLSHPLGQQTTNSYSWYSTTWDIQILEPTCMNIPEVDYSAWNLVLTEIIEPSLPNLQLPMHLHLSNVLHTVVKFGQGLAAIVDFFYWLNCYPLSLLYVRRLPNDATLDLWAAQRNMINKLLSYDETGMLQHVWSLRPSSPFVNNSVTTAGPSVNTGAVAAQRLPFPMLQYYLGINASSRRARDAWLTRQKDQRRYVLYNPSGATKFDYIGLEAPSFAAFFADPNVFDIWQEDTRFDITTQTLDLPAAQLASFYSPLYDQPILGLQMAYPGSCTYGYWLSHSLTPDTGSVSQLSAEDATYLPSVSMPPMLMTSRLSEALNGVISLSEAWSPILGPSWYTSYWRKHLGTQAFILLREARLAAIASRASDYFQNL